VSGVIGEPDRTTTARERAAAQQTPSPALPGETREETSVAGETDMLSPTSVSGSRLEAAQDQAGDDDLSETSAVPVPTTLPPLEEMQDEPTTPSGVSFDDAAARHEDTPVSPASTEEVDIEDMVISAEPDDAELSAPSAAAAAPAPKPEPEPEAEAEPDAEAEAEPEADAEAEAEPDAEADAEAEPEADAEAAADAEPEAEAEADADAEPEAEADADPDAEADADADADAEAEAEAEADAEPEPEPDPDPDRADDPISSVWDTASLRLTTATRDAMADLWDTASPGDDDPASDESAESDMPSAPGFTTRAGRVDDDLYSPASDPTARPVDEDEQDDDGGSPDIFLTHRRRLSRESDEDIFSSQRRAAAPARPVRTQPFAVREPADPTPPPAAPRRPSSAEDPFRAQAKPEERGPKEQAAEHFEAGLAHMRKGERDEARVQWEKAAALDPDKRMYKINLRRLDKQGTPDLPASASSWWGDDKQDGES